MEGDAHMPVYMEGGVHIPVYMEGGVHMPVYMESDAHMSVYHGGQCIYFETGFLCFSSAQAKLATRKASRNSLSLLCILSEGHSIHRLLLLLQALHLV